MRPGHRVAQRRTVLVGHLSLLSGLHINMRLKRFIGVIGFGPKIILSPNHRSTRLCLRYRSNKRSNPIFANRSWSRISGESQSLRMNYKWKWNEWPVIADNLKCYASFLLRSATIPS